ncbi:MAG TPA: cytochrome c maturation protein CcmE [Ignavibacteria bacterium]|nr:cytochrome c maturation protein CcmE [Ignavibacteria bacterium]HQY52206.1 cytochrome c maturation protein CcmE [Ignavibacteria bacterium]HRA98834.1 cytochrome c maturation protein CcmE [Ignavibacteria bacterium]
MNKKTIIGVLLIAVFLVVGFLTFTESNIEYTNFDQASGSHRTCQVKGYWQKDKEAKYDAATNQFTFYMLDESNKEMKVVLDGSRPNNFEMAESVVAKGKVKDGNFYAKEVLTKCPSKYEGEGHEVKKTGT